jgi:hypothetical protein
MASGSVGILTQIGGRKPEVLGEQIRGDQSLVGGRRKDAVADESVNIFSS